MQELRLVAVSEDGTYLVLATAGRGTRFSLPVDDRLRAVVRGHFSRLGQYEIEVESPLRPKEIQARIRSGETAEAIAETAGIPVERVRWFEGPVLQEREYMAQQAQRVIVRNPADGTVGPPLGELVEERLGRRGVDLEEVEWDSWKCDDGTWRLRLSFFVDARPYTADWTFDARRRTVSPLDDEASRLSSQQIAEADSDTVTPFVPRRPMTLVPGAKDTPGGARETPGASHEAPQTRPPQQRPGLREAPRPANAPAAPAARAERPAFRARGEVVFDDEPSYARPAPRTAPEPYRSPEPPLPRPSRRPESPAAYQQPTPDAPTAPVETRPMTPAPAARPARPDAVRLEAGAASQFEPTWPDPDKEESMPAQTAHEETPQQRPEAEPTTPYEPPATRAGDEPARTDEEPVLGAGGMDEYDGPETDADAVGDYDDEFAEAEGLGGTFAPDAGEPDRTAPSVARMTREEAEPPAARVEPEPPATPTHPATRTSPAAYAGSAQRTAPAEPAVRTSQDRPSATPLRPAPDPEPTAPAARASQGPAPQSPAAEASVPAPKPRAQSSQAPTAKSEAPADRSAQPAPAATSTPAEAASTQPGQGRPAPRPGTRPAAKARPKPQPKPQQPPAPQSPAARLGKPADAEAPTADEPAVAAAAPTASKPRKKSSRARRASVPSWDEIMFGARRPE